MEKGYKRLQIYQEAHSPAVKVHLMTLSLPSFERYEEGSQIRRSSKSVPSNIVEGYALRKYKKEFVHYLFRAYGSCEETVEHLELLRETKSFPDETASHKLVEAYNFLCGKLLRYIQVVDRTYSMPNFINPHSSQTSNLKPQTNHAK